MAPITPSNLLKHELIGLHVKVSDSSDPKLVGMKGTIVDETKNMLHVHDGKRLMMFSKKVSTFQLRLPDGQTVLVDGRHIVAQPQDRLKIKTRSW
jgi:ribonuclease P protein subunit POP4